MSRRSHEHQGGEYLTLENPVRDMASTLDHATAAPEKINATTSRMKSLRDLEEFDRVVINPMRTQKVYGSAMFHCLKFLPPQLTLPLNT